MTVIVCGGVPTEIAPQPRNGKKAGSTELFYGVMGEAADLARPRWFWPDSKWTPPVEGFDLGTTGTCEERAFSYIPISAGMGLFFWRERFYFARKRGNFFGVFSVFFCVFLCFWGGVFVLFGIFFSSAR